MGISDALIQIAIMDVVTQVLSAVLPHIVRPTNAMLHHALTTAASTINVEVKANAKLWVSLSL